MQTCHVCIGASGSGKSTKAIELAKQTGAIHLSSDYLRGVIGKDEGDQTVSARAFETLDFMLEYLLKFGHSVIVDTTAKNPKARKPLLDIAKKYNANVVAHCFKTSIETCKFRNFKRERKVPGYIIDGQFRALIWPTAEEGFNEIIDYVS